MCWHEALHRTRATRGKGCDKDAVHRCHKPLGLVGIGGLRQKTSSIRSLTMLDIVLKPIFMVQMGKSLLLVVKVFVTWPEGFHFLYGFSRRPDLRPGI